MIAASVDYRLKDRDSIEVPLECVKDAKSSIRFLRKNSITLMVDTGNIVVAGASAGGQLAAALATIKSMDTNDDCKIDLLDFAEFAFQWLACGYDIQEACWE